MGFEGFNVEEGIAVGRRDEADVERTWMWIKGLAGWDGMVMQSSLSRIDRTARTFSCKVLKIEGESRRIMMASEAATERAAGMAAEKTKEVPLIR